MRTIQRDIVSALVFSKDNKLLMGRKDPKSGGVYTDSWHIPGGGVEEGEDQPTALQREIMEEVGIDISNSEVALVDALGKGETEKTLKGTNETVLCKMKFYVYKIVLREDANKIETLTNGDLIELKWIDLDSLNNYKLTPPSKELFARLGYLIKK